MQIDRSKSLQQLEGDDWGDPGCDDPLITEPYRLHRVPLGGLTVEDLRMMIAMGIGLEYLIPISLERLHDHPFAWSSPYPCNLLAAMLGVGSAFWQDHPDLRYHVAAIADRDIAAFHSSPAVGYEMVAQAVIKASEKFKGHEKFKGRHN
jgi:hypothetical protein